MTFITVDLDDPTAPEIARSWRLVEEISDGDVRGRVSSSGCGVHIRSHKYAPDPVPLNPVERAVCGDDPSRILIDIRNTLESNQVMWDKKYGNYSGEWVTDLGELLLRYTSAVLAGV